MGGVFPTWKTTIMDVIGYGQLSISSTPGGLVAHPKNGAGVWAVLGGDAAVESAKSSGLDATAAVVAKSLLAYDAVNGQSADGRGIYGHSVNQQGVVGESDKESGVTAITHNTAKPAIAAHNPGGRAGNFEGDVEVSGKMSAQLVSALRVEARDDIVLTGGDCAEEFDLAADEAGEPGTVMVIDEMQCLNACDEAYDPRVTGIVAGAGELPPWADSRSQSFHL